MQKNYEPIVLLTIPELCELLKVSESTVRRLQESRKLPFIKVKGSVRFHRRDIDAYLEQQTVKAIV